MHHSGTAHGANVVLGAGQQAFPHETVEELHIDDAYL